MAEAVAWTRAFARQAAADYEAFDRMQEGPFPDCHRLQFLQMACEKLVKAHLVSRGSDPEIVQTSHAYIAKNLPIVLREQSALVNLGSARARAVLGHAKRLATEIEVLSPAVTRDGQRPDNCEYPWEDHGGNMRSPLDWSFASSHLVIMPAGRTILKLVRAAIDRLLVS
jgi:hypothetical protein